VLVPSGASHGGAGAEDLDVRHRLDKAEHLLGASERSLLATSIRHREQNRLASLAASREQERLHAIEKAASARNSLAAERETWQRQKREAESAHRAEITALRRLHDIE